MVNCRNLPKFCRLRQQPPTASAAQKSGSDDPANPLDRFLVRIRYIPTIGGRVVSDGANLPVVLFSERIQVVRLRKVGEKLAARLLSGLN